MMMIMLVVVATSTELLLLLVREVLVLVIPAVHHNGMSMVTTRNGIDKRLLAMIISATTNPQQNSIGKGPTILYWNVTVTMHSKVWLDRILMFSEGTIPIFPFFLMEESSRRRTPPPPLNLKEYNSTCNVLLQETDF